jgi:hypothetical protein
MSDPRDPHLLAALRHAPDRDALPPPELSARILAAARDAVRPLPAASPWSRFANWWVQPQVGAAFATLALATLLGVMWSTHEPPAAPTAPSPLAKAPPAVPAMPLAPPMTVPAPAAEPRTAAKAERRQAPAREASARAVDEARPATTPSAASPPPAEAVVAKTDAAPPAPLPPAAPPPAMAAAPAPLAESARRARDDRADRATAMNEPGALAAGRAAAPATLSLAARPPLDPLQVLDATPSEAWTWSGSALRGERAHGEPQRALWAAMREATQNRWQPAATPVATPDPWLALQQGQGARPSTFWLADGALYVVDAQGRAWRAPIGAEQARDWQQAVGSW